MPLLNYLGADLYQLLKDALQDSPGWRERSVPIMEVIEGRAVRVRVAVHLTWYEGPAEVRDVLCTKAIAGIAELMGEPGDGQKPKVTDYKNYPEMRSYGAEVGCFMYPDGSIVPRPSLQENKENE